MEGSRKIAAGIIIFIGLIVWCLAPAFAQTMDFKFHPDGSMTNTYDGPKGYSFERYDDKMRVLEVLHYFPGGVRMKMFDKYRYENDMLVEHVSYIYTQGYERETFRFNEFGYETESRHYTSQTEGNWVEDQYTINEYDDHNNSIYWRTKGTRFGELINRMTRRNYDYANRRQSGVEYEFDANDREISARSFQRGMADWHYGKKGKYVFDIKTHGANLRPERVIYWNDSDRNGNRVEKVFMNHNAVAKTIDYNGRVIRMELGSPSYDDNNDLYYKYDEYIDFRYDHQGRLIETESKHYSKQKEKWTYKHGRKVEAKHYRMKSNGSWGFVKTVTYDNIDVFTPQQSGSNGHQSVASSVQQGNGSAVSYEPARPQSSVSQNRPVSGSSLVNDLNGLNIESNESESLSAFSMDAEKLSHIADVLSHATGTRISEEHVLALAMQLLIQNYNADLREMNNAYLKDKVSVFD